MATSSRRSADASAGSADDLVTALLTASRALVGVSARSLAAVEGTLTPTQFRTLVVLEQHGASGLKQLARRLEVQASTALRQVDRMVAAGFVRRTENERDRREVVIELTTAGRRLVARVTRRRRTAIERIVTQMPDDRRLDLVEALVAFAAAADEPLAADAAATRLGW